MNHSIISGIDQPEIRITRANRELLDRLLADHAPIRSWRAVEFLVRELARATIVDDDVAPGDLVTMRSRVSFREENSGTIETVTLAYPGESGLYDDAMSVLTPLGAALLGLSRGQSISYPRPGGGLRTITVVEVHYQPEAVRHGALSSADVRRLAPSA
jgi:regulator of nucleoside diphosphate kinase